MIIHFHLHPALGNKDLLKSSQVFSVNPKTLEGWMTKTSMKIKWADMVGDLNFDDVVNSIPKYSSSVKLKLKNIDAKRKKLNFKRTSG